jgi:5,6-dimethylbenzimidazole synthase
MTKSGDTSRYEAFVEIARNRITTRAFQADYVIPRDHFELILEAARHAPSGANAQPWHFIVVTDPETKRTISEYFVEEQHRRARLGMKFPTPDYRGMASAPGFVVVATDFRLVRAFPVLRNEDPDSPVNRLYYENAERILLQSVAAATMSAHLAAAALGYNVWWVTAIGQQDAQEAIKPLLGVPDELSIIDVMCFGPPAKHVYKRWKKSLDEIVSWDRFNKANFIDDDQIEEWIRKKRHRVMYRDEANVD